MISWFVISWLFLYWNNIIGMHDCCPVNKWTQVSLNWSYQIGPGENFKSLIPCMHWQITTIHWMQYFVYIKIMSNVWSYNLKGKRHLLILNIVYHKSYEVILKANMFGSKGCQYFLCATCIAWSAYTLRAPEIPPKFWWSLCCLVLRFVCFVLCTIVPL